MGNTSISELRFLRSESNISGTLMPTSLQMNNTLGAAFYDYISDYGSYISDTDILNFGSGGSLSTQVSTAPYGY